MNPHERQARVVKAMKLIAAVGGVAAKFGLDPVRVAAAADEGDRKTFAWIAGVHPPSDETWALVRESLEGAQKIAAQVTDYDSLTGEHSRAKE